MFDGKGKEKVQPVIRIGLKWEGRLGRVEQQGLPLRPPGKMFRPDYRIAPFAGEPIPAAPVAGIPTYGSAQSSKS